MNASGSGHTLSAAPSAPDNGSALYLAMICLVASLGGLLFGFDTAVISGTIEFVKKQFSLGRYGVGWFGSSALVGCILGAAVAGVCADRFGRKPVLVVAAFFFAPALRCTITPDFPWLVIARIVGGLGVGMAPTNDHLRETLH